MRSGSLFLVFLAAPLVQGCVTASLPESSQSAALIADFGPLPEASLGMRREDVAGLLDREVIIGYEKDPVNGEFVPRKLKSLYSTEVLEANGIEYQVDSYLVVGRAVGNFGESDLFPLIYQKGILVGKGQVELEAVRSRIRN